MDSELVVLGGGPGGYAAAFLAADLGIETTLVDLEPRLGGVCLLRGCIPSKALLHVAKAMAEARHLADWGVTYAAPRVDIDAVRARKEKVIATLTGGLKQLAAQRKVRLVQARATFADSQTLELQPVGDRSLEENRLRFQHCILATGSRPTRIPAFELPTPRVMDSTGALELADVPESLLVVGGGYIGLEMGTVYAALGSRVSVVELTDGLLPGADRDLVKPLQKRLEKQFEGVFLGTQVTGLADKGQAVEVTFDGPVEKKVQQFSRVLVSVGRRPNSENLGLEKTKTQVTPRGFVQVDAQQRTADPHILAIGDVAGDPMLAHKAAHEGRVAAEVLAGHTARFEPRAIPAVVFTDPEIAWAGLTSGSIAGQFSAPSRCCGQRFRFPNAASPGLWPAPSRKRRGAFHTPDDRAARRPPSPSGSTKSGGCGPSPPRHDVGATSWKQHGDSRTDSGRWPRRRPAFPPADQETRNP